ncbi:unnamed protein product [Gongylonema pulchrum]|uniref:Uncharacterized protein n=1 Tax=Gongylonema pulchrum TaxID=637853 RepID=A0A183DRM0_9BILA|nr:unnamed protein product [Gongylonema pulchrum]
MECSSMYLDSASNGFYYQLEGNQGWRKKANTDGNPIGTHRHYHSVPFVHGQTPTVAAAAAVAAAAPLISHQQKAARSQKPMNTNPPQRLHCL